MKSKQILMCKDENKKRKIYYDLEKGTFGSIIDTEKNNRPSSIAFTGTISYLFFKIFFNITLDDTRVILMLYVVFTILGILIGSAIVIFRNKKSEEILLKPLKIDDQEVERCIKASRDQLSENRTGFYFLVFGIVFASYSIFSNKLLLFLFFLSVLWIIVIIIYDYHDFSRRKETYIFLSDKFCNKKP